MSGQDDATLRAIVERRGSGEFPFNVAAIRDLLDRVEAAEAERDDWRSEHARQLRAALGGADTGEAT